MDIAECHRYMNFGTAAIYIIIALGFTLRLLITHEIVDHTHFVYIGHYLTTQNSTEHVYYEHPSYICILACIIYACLCFMRNQTTVYGEVVRAIVDGIILALLLGLLVDVIDVLQFFSLSGVYMSFQVLMYWMSLSGVQHSGELLLFVLTTLWLIFWCTLLVMFVINWDSASWLQLSALLVFIMDLVLIEVYFRIQRTSFRWGLKELAYINVTRITLLICVFIRTL